MPKVKYLLAGAQKTIVINRIGNEGNPYVELKSDGSVLADLLKKVYKDGIPLDGLCLSVFTKPAGYNNL